MIFRILVVGILGEVGNVNRGRTLEVLLAGSSAVSSLDRNAAGDAEVEKWEAGEEMRWRRWAGGGRLEGGASVKVLDGPDKREMTNDAGGGGGGGRTAVPKEQSE